VRPTPATLKKSPHALGNFYNGMILYGAKIRSCVRGISISCCFHKPDYVCCIDGAISVVSAIHYQYSTSGIKGRPKLFCHLFTDLLCNRYPFQMRQQASGCSTEKKDTAHQPNAESHS
jgi:hypothetical protein